jgi:dTDP-4-dehydrorhamnose reductase
MRLLVTGAAGMLGSAVERRLGVEHIVKGIDLPDGDLTDARVVAQLLDTHDPQWIIHCAAWTNVDGAESSREQALAVNRDATGNLVQAAEKRGGGLTYISTDYVFNGEGPSEGYAEDHPRDPINHYGLTKAGGEELVQAMTGPWQIVRISWLFGDGPVNFPRTIRRLLGERETLRVVDDQRGCPTYTEDLADVLAFLVSGGHRGIFHGTNTGACTWYEFAREVAVRLDADPSRIIPCPSSEYPTAAVRPRCSVLRSSALEIAGCPPRPTWQDALGRYLALLESGQARHP